MPDSQEIESEREAANGYRADKHQSLVGTGYVDAVHSQSQARPPLRRLCQQFDQKAVMQPGPASIPA